MRIAIDIQTTLGQKTGFGHYVQNLVDQFAVHGGAHDYILVAPKSEKDLTAPQRFWWDQWELARKAKLAQADILHQPAFSAPLLFPGKIVVTIHDLIAIFYGGDIPFWSRQYFAHWMPFTYRRANAIITISEHTKRDVIRVLQIPEEKITVIYLAAAPEYRPIFSKQSIESIKQKYQTGAKYLLHLGTINPRKNLEFLVKVFAEVVKKYPDFKLVITGKKGWYYEGLFQLVSTLGLERQVVFTGYIDDADKPALYNAATIFLSPSLYEGFGLPALEAMQCGVPVISSSESSMPEVVGEAGMLLSPKESGRWVQAINQILSSQKIQDTMRAKGLKQAQKFSWSKTARQTVKVYEQLIG